MTAGPRSADQGFGVRVVRRLVRLFPPAFRERYGDEMVETYRDRCTEVRSAAVARSVLLARTAASLFAAALRERLDARRPRATGAGHEAAAPLTLGLSETRGSSMDRFAQDIRYAVRFLRRNPSFTAIVLATLALGIGMNTAVFSVLYGVLYRPLPYARPGELVEVGRTHPAIPNALLPLSPAHFLDVRGRMGTVASLEGAYPQTFVLTDPGEAGRHRGSQVTAGFLDVFGMPPALGRTFRPEDDAPGAEPVVVVSDAFWRTELGADPSAVGRQIRLNDEPRVVIGVMPPDFRFQNASIWAPFAWSDSARAQRGSNFVRMYGRRAPDATVAAVTAELERIWAPIRQEFPDGNQETGMAARTLAEGVAAANRRPLYILAGAAAFVLLIACANVANLLLVRAEHRQREVGVRAALGARPGRLARQFLTEALLLALVGGAFAVAIAYLGVRLLLTAFGSAVPRAQDIAIHAPVLLFALLASVLTGVLTGVVPALRTRPDFDALREGSRGGTARFTRLGRSLVVAEVALALMLVTGAGLLLKSYARATTSDLGFGADDLVIANLYLPPSRYGDPVAVQSLRQRLEARLEADPAVRGIAMASLVPIREYGYNFTEIGAVGRETKASFVEQRAVTPDYFETMNTRLLGGRLFTAAEADDTIVVINRTLARQLFGDDDPVGERLALWEGFHPQIIGVVADVRDFGPDQAPRPTVYGPALTASNIMIRTARDAGAVATAIRAALQQLDPDVALVRIEGMGDIVDQALTNRRFHLTLIAVFALTALVLACVGIYGVLSYSVARQTREIGVRMALGARAAAVASAIVWRGGRLALGGVAIGVAGALLSRRVIASQLFGVEPFDPVVYFAVSALLLLVAALACWLPARRAAAIAPTQALRVE